MVKTILVEKNIENGKKLIEALDNKKLLINAALWFLMADIDEWRLIIATPIVDKDGIKNAYESVQLVINDKNIDISLKDISVVSPNDNLIKLLKIAIKTGPGISGIRFSKSAINNTFIEDAYIYRLN